MDTAQSLADVAPKKTSPGFQNIAGRHIASRKLILAYICSFADVNSELTYILCYQLSVPQCCCLKDTFLLLRLNTVNQHDLETC